MAQGRILTASKLAYYKLKLHTGVCKNETRECILNLITPHRLGDASLLGIVNVLHIPLVLFTIVHNMPQ